MIYLDHNASNPPDPRLVAVYTRAMELGWANPSSIHTPGRRARAIVEEAREQVAALGGVAPGQVTFTSSGTEALNQALETIAPPRGEAPARVVASAVEHAAVRAKLAELEAAGRVVVAEAPVDEAGRVDPDRFAALLREGAALAVVLAAQNEVGTVQPLEALGAACAAAGVPLLVDASQAAGRIERVWGHAPWDYLVLSAHKLRAPRGAGALLHRGRAPEPRPLLLGGSQERGRRAGTEPVPAIAALGAACARVGEGTLLEPKSAGALLAERQRFEARLVAEVPGLRVLASSAPRLPQTTAVVIAGQESEPLLAALDLAGVHASSGSACSSGALEPSHVLAAMAVPPELARSRLRFSFGPETTPAELDRAVEALRAAVG